jgi:uncharacterized membrane protein
MKKYFIFGSLATAILVFANCGPSKKIATVPVLKSSYEKDVQTLIMANCTPCHIPANGGFKRAYDNFINVKTDIDEIIRRISLNPTDRGFMPFKKTEKLNDSSIAVFKKWKVEGLLEK